MGRRWGRAVRYRQPQARTREVEAFIAATYPGLSWDHASLRPAGCFRVYRVEGVPVAVTFDSDSICPDLFADLRGCVGGRDLGPVAASGWCRVKLTGEDRATLASVLLERKGPA